MKYFEDFTPGTVIELGRTPALTEEEIIAFSRQFDPQYFHVDPEQAKNSIYGGLIASGLHSVGLMMRLFVDHFLLDLASMGSPGIDEIRFLLPLRPGESLSVVLEIMGATPSRSKPDRGVLDLLLRATNQNQVLAIIHRGKLIIGRRPVL